MTPNFLLASYGNRLTSLKSNSFLGTFSKRLLKPNSLYPEISEKNELEDKFSVVIRGWMKPTSLFGDDLADQAGSMDENKNDEHDASDIVEAKRNFKFWASRGKKNSEVWTC